MQTTPIPDASAPQLVDVEALRRRFLRRRIKLSDPIALVIANLAFERGAA